MTASISVYPASIWGARLLVSDKASAEKNTNVLLWENRDIPVTKSQALESTRVAWTEPGTLRAAPESSRMVEPLFEGGVFRCGIAVKKKNQSSNPIQLPQNHPNQPRRESPCRRYPAA